MAERVATAYRTFTMQQIRKKGAMFGRSTTSFTIRIASMRRRSLGATEIWTFQNNSGEAHPMHIHDIQWQILDVNGVPSVARR